MFIQEGKEILVFNECNLFSKYNISNVLAIQLLFIIYVIEILITVYHSSVEFNSQSL